MNNDIFVREINLLTPREIFLKEYELDEASMINLGSKNKAGECFIKIKSNEGPNKPHFHIESKSSDFHCCVMIYEPLYFHHIKDESDLSKSQCEILDVSLRDGIWDDLDEAWRSAYSGELFTKYCKNAKLDIDNLEQPNYKLLH